MALHQSNLLSFQHRFQPFTQQQFGSHVLNQPNLFQGQQSQVQQVLLPPQQEILRPPPPSPNPPRHPQSLIFQQNPVDDFRSQPVQNQQVRNQEQNLRFQQQNNFVGQDQAFANQRANFQRILPQQPFNQQAQQQFNQQQNGFSQQFQKQRPFINQQPVTNPPQVSQQQALLNQQQLLVNHQQAILNQQQSFRQNFQQQQQPPVFSNNQNFQQQHFQQNQQQNFAHFQQQNPPKTAFFSTSVPKAQEDAVFRANSIQNPVQRPTFEFQPAPQQPVTRYPIEVETQPTPQQQNENSNVLLQKSREQHQYRLGGNYLTTGRENQVTQTTRPTTVQNFVTTPVVPNTPKPIVKEIRINLDENNNPITDSPQLFIKDTRQKQFHQIRQQNKHQQHQQPQPQQSSKKEKSQKPSQSDKTQEDLINEQIQKLLQRHNLEIIDKEKDSSESQEAQLSQVSKVLKGKYNYNVQLVSGGSILKESKDKKPTTPRPPRTTTLPPLPDLPEHIKKEYDIKLVNKEDFFKQFDIVGGERDGKALGNNTLFLANGQELEIVSVGPDGKMKKLPLGKRPSKKSVITTTTTTVKPPKVLFEELAKGVIPPGADFELIKQNDNGEIEKVSDVSNAKKVTFVLLEEQPDGSVKVQGVKGNGNSDSNDRDSVNSIIKRIKEGSLKLPPARNTQSSSLFTNEIPRLRSATIKSFVTLPTLSTAAYKTTRYHAPASSPIPRHYSTPEPSPTPTEGIYDIYADINAITTEVPTASTTRRIKQKPRISFLPTLPSTDATVTPTFSSQRIKPTSSSTYLLRSTLAPKPKAPKRVVNKLSSKYEDPNIGRTEATTFRTVDYPATEVYTAPPDVIAEESSIDNSRPLTEILKDHGLNQMAKFLDQSGLDTILNETGTFFLYSQYYLILLTG